MKHSVLQGQDQIGALVILNGPSLSYKLLSLVWPRVDSTTNCPIVCADGGANLLYDTTKSYRDNSEEGRSRGLEEWIPSHIVGDLDSLRPEVQQWYEARGTKIVRDENENMHDFEKSLIAASDLRAESELPTVVLGGHGGRMDQTLGNLNTLYSWAERKHTLYWLEEKNVVLALHEGKHHINIDASSEGPSCGLVPIGKPVASVSTDGLKWNLNSQKLAFGKDGLVSTSNCIVEQVVIVEISDPLIWTCELRLSISSK